MFLIIFVLILFILFISTNNKKKNIKYDNVAIDSDDILKEHINKNIICTDKCTKKT